MKTQLSVLVGGMILLVAVLGGGALAQDPAPDALTPEGVRALIEKLRSDRFDERTEAAERLEKGVTTDALIDVLAEFADDASLEVRQRVRKLLRAKGWIHVDDRARIKVWLAALRGDDRDARRKAFEGLLGYDVAYSDPFGRLRKLKARKPRLEFSAPSLVILEKVEVDGAVGFHGSLKAKIGIRNWSKDPIWIEDGKDTVKLVHHQSSLLPGNDHGGSWLFRVRMADEKIFEPDGGWYRILDGKKRLDRTMDVSFDAPGRYRLELSYDPDGNKVTVEGGAPIEIPLETGTIARARTVVVLPPLEEGEFGPSADDFRLGLRTEVLKERKGGQPIVRVDLSIENGAKAKRPFKGIVGGSWGGAWIAVLDGADRMYAHQRFLRRDEAEPKGADVAQIAGGGKLERRFDLTLPLPQGTYRIIAGYSTKVDEEHFAEIWSNVVTIEVE